MMKSYDCNKKLFVDVSVLARCDARTGIQRVVRSIWLELINTARHGFDVIPVAGARRGQYRVIRKDFLERPLRRLPFALGRARLKPRQGDVFLGLDLAAHVAPRNSAQFQAWRSEEHTSELQSLMRISYAVFCLKKKKHKVLYKNINST